ncbi:MAG: gentisate 1,2-dioxygenase [Acidobacteriia bacterium]|nr:gentisate 1,2-dioxygenase [Terriglobia bacterium]
MDAAFHSKLEGTAERSEFYQRLNEKSAAPLWEVLAEIVRTEPRTACVPALWRYEDVRPLVMESGKIITAKEAERRVLILENPGLRGQSRITQSLYAGMQLVLPGEIAPSHRHTASALRFILEGDGGYTAVDGERTTMHAGDLILTPSWTFHDHGNPSDRPVVWLDGLDIPTVNHFDTSFAEHHPEETQPVTRGEGDALARYGANLLPLEYTPRKLAAPLLSYPYARSRAALEQLHRNGPAHPCHGVKMQYVNPATGGYPMPTMGAFLQLLPAGFRGAACRSTDATVYCCVEGCGHTQAGDHSFEWKEHDVFVVPSWCPVSHRAHEEAVLFSFSDRPAQKALGIWREDGPTPK